MILLPEKYYEACITYHIVKFYEMHYAKRVYPFSISQIREKEKGFDFGYNIPMEQIFFVQYKRPLSFQPVEGEIRWEINIEQMNTILNAGIGWCTYYALPAFFQISDWYHGLEKTWFISADDLCTQLRLYKKIKEKTTVVNAKKYAFKGFQEIFLKKGYQNVLLEEDYKRDFSFWEQLSEENEIWGYCIKDR